jgi:hypothetical protein
MTLLASGIVKTGVMRKFSLTHCRRYGNDVSTWETEYAYFGTATSSFSP